ncbi:MAG: hypothetical protein A2X94_11095 [Bdellovibrionales bacterium GWB1_55_8]|nr:MAG: hypothetical protein A2X94_11095 [Bdellovibrionales bacterium GWB1_55_8]
MIDSPAPGLKPAVTLLRMTFALGISMGASLAGCGPAPEPAKDNQSLTTEAESSFLFSYRIYRSRTRNPKKFEDLIPTSYFKDISRQNEDDYHFDILQNTSVSPPRLSFSLFKWPTPNEDDVYAEMHFRMPASYLEPGKTFECAFNPSDTSKDCTVSAEISSLSRHERLFLPSAVRSPLICRFQLSDSTLPVGADGLLTKPNPRFPSKPGTPEARERLGFGFHCEDKKHKVVALHGYFLQNSREIPQFP